MACLINAQIQKLTVEFLTHQNWEFQIRIREFYGGRRNFACGIERKLEIQLTLTMAAFLNDAMARRGWSKPDGITHQTHPRSRRRLSGRVSANAPIRLAKLFGSLLLP